MRVIVDVSLSPFWTLWLHDAGIKADHWSRLGPSDAPDIDIIAFAQAADCTILTADLDFGVHLASSGSAKPSIIQVRAISVSPRVIATRIIEDLHNLKSQIEQGAIITIDLTRTRITPLPFPRRAQEEPK